MTDLSRNQILVGDARPVLATLPAASIDTVVTSPPYFRLRNYQHDGQIGLEAHVDQWVDELVLVARGLRRVLKPSGSFWLNLGDTFARSAAEGAPPKSLVLAPERLALALVADGWILRNKVVWAKPNPMPSSVRDRLSCTWEVVYFLTPNRTYFFDLDAIRIPHRSGGNAAAHLDAKASIQTSSKEKHGDATGPVDSGQGVRLRNAAWSVPTEWQGPSAGSNSGLDKLKASGLAGHPLGKNPGDVWSVPTAGFRGAHHAVFPERLVERPLLATCPEKVCAGCGRPWRREAHRTIGHLAVVGELRQDCRCDANVGTRPGVVLDPFMGSGTTATVAERLGREWVGIELNEEFAGIARERIAVARPTTGPRRATPEAA